MNSLFGKTLPRKCTWLSLRGKTNHEIDFVLSTEKKVQVGIMLSWFIQHVRTKISTNSTFAQKERQGTRNNWIWINYSSFNINNRLTESPLKVVNNITGKKWRENLINNCLEETRKVMDSITVIFKTNRK